MRVVMPQQASAGVKDTKADKEEHQGTPGPQVGARAVHEAQHQQKQQKLNDLLIDPVNQDKGAPGLSRFRDRKDAGQNLQNRGQKVHYQVEQENRVMPVFSPEESPNRQNSQRYCEEVAQDLESDIHSSQF